ncbi:hypothetical protein ACIA8O_26475 [Kitasatospora sp. NPDC051853]|uniref:hypothetical protein n=1 Tax=Kitasatospora sp. NPDC051853 TaxID=3364058 RepID=UPI0037AF614A
MADGDVAFDWKRVHRDGMGIYGDTGLDSRKVLTEMPRRVKDGFLLDEVPWARFMLGDHRRGHVPARHLIVQACSADAGTVDRALTGLFHLLFSDYVVRASAPLTVPFLIRLAVVPERPCRADALGLAAALARYGDHLATREYFLETVTPDIRFSPDGYLLNWTLEASRIAVTADTDLLLPLLHDPDPQLRTAAADILGTALGPTDHITAALRDRLTTEPAPAVRAALVLACAELARNHPTPHTTDWPGTLWPAPDQPGDVRIAAALARLCLTTDPVSDDLRTFVEAFVATDAQHVLDGVPWFARNGGLAATVQRLLDVPTAEGC